MPKKKPTTKKDKTLLLLKSLQDKEETILYTEEALLETMNRFRDLFEQSPIGVGIHDTKGELLLVNNAYLKTFGVSKFKDIKSHNLFSSHKLPKIEVKKLKSGEVLQAETELDFSKTKHASSIEDIVDMFLTVSPILRDDSIIGYMAQIQDITERNKIAESQRMAQLGMLLSEMAHEVNNPLMAISGNAEVSLMRGVDNPELKNTLEIILEECLLAKDIMQRLLKYSRLGKTIKEPFDIVKAVELIVSMLEPHFKSSDITLKKSVKKDVPSVYGNEKQIQEVFMNLLRNSADAIKKGGLITVTISKSQEFVKIQVKDTGAGMSKKVMKKVFEPFYTTKQKGTGLGLAVSYSIIEEHSGVLKFTSQIGKGTTATMLLPAA